jgi:phage baseplate assembly protein W
VTPEDLVQLIGRLDRAGIPGCFAESTALILRGVEVVQAADDRAAAAERLRADLVQGMLDKGLSLDEVARRLSEVMAWLPSAPAGEGQRRPARGSAVADLVADPVARQLGNRAVQAARAAGLDVHKSIAGRVAAVVKQGVAAGQRLIDVRRVATILTPPKWKRPPEGTGHFYGDSQGAPQHPWRSNPPVLPTLDFADVQRDPARLTAWAEAADAYAAFLELHELAAAVHAVTVGSSTMFAPGKVDRDALAFLTDGLPEVVHLAVTDALGWKPGLHLSLKPAPVRSPGGEDKMAGWATPAQQQAVARQLLSGQGVR